MPPILKYLIAAKDVEIRLACTFAWHGSTATFFRHSPPNTDRIATFSATNMSAAFNDSLASRLNKLNLAVIDAGFSSLADALIHEINCFSDRGALGKRAVAFYKQGDCSKLIAAVIDNKRFTSQGHPAIIDIVSRLLDHEIQVLSTSSDLRCTMAEFSPQHIGEFSPNHLAELQSQYAPILSTVFLNLAKAKPGSDNPTERVSDDGLFGAGSGLPVERQVKQRPRGNKIIATTALAMLCYARNDLSNALQV